MEANEWDMFGAMKCKPALSRKQHGQHTPDMGSADLDRGCGCAAVSCRGWRKTLDADKTAAEKSPTEDGTAVAGETAVWAGTAAVDEFKSVV